MHKPIEEGWGLGPRVGPTPREEFRQEARLDGHAINYVLAKCIYTFVRGAVVNVFLRRTFDPVEPPLSHTHSGASVHAHCLLLHTVCSV